MATGLRLEVSLCRGSPPESPQRLERDVGSCTLGRNPDNDLQLGDPERLVSGRHARIEIGAEAVRIYDLSTNGTFLNRSASRLPQGQAVELHDGDRLGIGPYEILVSIRPDQGLGGSDPFAAGPFAPGPSLVEPSPMPGMAGPGPAPDIMELLGGALPGPVAPAQRRAADDPFADAQPLDSKLSGPAPEDHGPRAAEPRQTPVEHVFFRPPESQGIPEGYDLLNDALPSALEALAARPGAGPAPGPAPVFPPDLESAPDTEPASGPASGPAPGPSLDLSLDLDGDLDTGPSVPPPVRPVGPAAPPQSPMPVDLGPSPRPAAGPDPGAGARHRAGGEPGPGTAPPAGPPPAGSDADLLAALLAGLGAGDPGRIADPQAFAQQCGALLRALTAGLAATMMARASFKSELRLGVTTIRRTENNPFKLSASPEEALDRLLLRPNPAYLAPLDAAREAFEDIQAHEMAMIAGLRGALRSLLARFEPAALESRLSAASGLDRLLPMARKARLWDLLAQTHGQVAADAAEDFMQLFGESFNRAYEDQILRLAKARGRRPS